MVTEAGVRTPPGLTAPLRLPRLGDATAAAYKEWLHLNVFGHDDGSIGLINTSLHADPRDPRAVALGTALFHHPTTGWHHHVEVAAAGAVALGWASMSMSTMAMAAGLRGGDLAASVAADDGGILARLHGREAVARQNVPGPMPFGTGWIGWSVAPRLRLSGRLELGGQAVDVGRASGYHDRNWGRWHWGDDAGWEWGAFLAAEPAPAVVFARATDRAHRRGLPSLGVHAPHRKKLFRGDCVAMQREGRLDEPLVRVPGAMAGLHSGRSKPRLPSRVLIGADDGRDRLQIDFRVRAAAQIIAGDPIVRGYGFLHELVGEFSCEGRVSGVSLAFGGLGVCEHVD